MFAALLQETFQRLTGLSSDISPHDDLIQCQACFDQAVNLLIDQTYLKVRLLPNYEKRLRTPVEKAFTLINGMVDSMPDAQSNPVDGDQVPAFHFGVVLSVEDWDALVDRLRSAGADFLIEPRVRFEGQPGEQRTCFVRDPAGNALEFKAFRDLGQLFATD